MDQIWLYTVNPDGEEPIMLINKHIGFDETDGFGIMGDLFQRELLALDEMGKKRIQVWINSEGGIVKDGYDIYNAILRSKTKVDTYNTGMAASIAGVIFQAGRKRIMADYSWLMYHNPYGGDDKKGLDAVKDSIVKMVASRCEKDEDAVRGIMNKTSYITAQEALDNGLCDAIEDSGDQNRKRMAVVTDLKARWMEADKITNKLLPHLNNTDMTNLAKVANRLNLNPEATEDSIVKAIDAIENKAATLQTETETHLKTIANKTTEVEDAKNALKAMEEECNNLKNKIASMEEEEKKKEEEAKNKEEQEQETKAKNMIDAFVVEGRLKNEEAVKNKWLDSCKKLGLEEVKNLIEQLPINKPSAKMQVSNAGGSGNASAKLTSVVRNKMAEKLNKMSGVEQN